MADAVAAGIKRASAAARKAMEALDTQALDELERIYREAAANVRAAIENAAAAGGTGQVELAHLRPLLAVVEGVLANVAAARDTLLASALQQAADLGVQPVVGDAQGGRPVLSPGDAAKVADTAVNFVRTWRAADGLALSDRLWRVDSGARQAVLGAIEQAVVRGYSADRAAAELIYRGQEVDVATRAAQAAAEVGRVVRAGDVLQDGNTGVLANTLRVVRTEINRAHGEAYMAGAAKVPGFAGFRFLLSPAHPRPDVCDLYAQQNLHGLGPGVYPTREATPWPAHPNTLSFVVVVFAADVSAADKAGQETTLEALQRLGPDIRAGVLGPTKAGYFDQGVLTRGMVRAPVAATTARLRRTGRLGGL